MSVIPFLDKSPVLTELDLSTPSSRRVRLLARHPAKIDPIPLTLDASSFACGTSIFMSLVTLDLPGPAGPATETREQGRGYPGSWRLTQCTSPISTSPASHGACVCQMPGLGRSLIFFMRSLESVLSSSARAQTEM